MCRVVPTYLGGTCCHGILQDGALAAKREENGVRVAKSLWWARGGSALRELMEVK